MDSINASLQIAAGVLATLKPHPERMRAALVPEMLATDLAECVASRRVARQLEQQRLRNTG